MRVAQLMEERVIAASGDEPLGEIRDKMASQDLQSLPIVDETDRPVGIVTASDLLVDLEPSLPVSRVMSREVLTIDEGADAGAAARRMLAHRVHHLVVTRDGRMVGLLSSFDLLRAVGDAW